MSDTSRVDLSEAMDNSSVTSDDSDKTPVLTEKTISLRNNPIAIRACILSDVVRRKPIERAFREFQRELGEDLMTFGEYEYWYYRFYDGKLDLEHDRSSDPKMKEFSDLPVDVVGLIIKRSDYKEQLKLRKTSKSLRSLVDEQSPACKLIKVSQYAEEIRIAFTNHSATYSDDPDYELEDVNHKVMRDDYEKIAFDDLASTLKHPKLHLEEFELNSAIDNQKRGKFFDNIRRVLESLNHQLSVKKCTIQVSNPSQFLSILPYLEPGKLKEVSFRLQKNRFDWSTDSEEMKQFASLEQWKQAEKLDLVYSFDRFPMKYATHFKQFYIYEKVLDGEKFVRIRDYLSKLDNFDHCELKRRRTESSHPLDITITNQMGTLVSRNSSTKKVYHYPIADSDDYLEFKTSSARCIHIHKKKKSSNSLS